MNKLRTDTNLLVIGQLIMAMADRYPRAIAALELERSTIDERTGSGEKVRTSAGTSTTESQALRSAWIDDQAADLAEHRRDFLHTARLFVQRIEDAIVDHHRRMGTKPAELAAVKLCDGKGRGYDGHQLPWVEQSRDPGNGWHDPTCREIADDTGLCPRCRKRMNRWRGEHGLTLVGVMPAQVAS